MEKKLGLASLTALVLSSMLGAGIFSLPQNMAEVASPAALLIGWGITGIGILFLAMAMLLLTRLRPDLDGGIFTYAKEGFGELLGFCSAWGYWLCAVIANVSYLVIVFAALSFFTDTPDSVIFGDGNTWQSIIGESILLWGVHFLILRGVKTAASINLVTTLTKLLPITLFVALAIFSFKIKIFNLDFTGIALKDPVWQQVKNTMLYTLWVFIGVEGATVVSSRAKNKKDIGRATMLAVCAALSIYLLITLLSMGIMPRTELTELRNPSMAGLMVKMVGPIGQTIIASALVISVCGAYLSWTIMAAEVPLLAAQQGIFPKVFAKQNSKESPVASLWLTNWSVQVTLVIIWLTKANYNNLLTIASEMILVPYLLVGLYLLKLSLTQPNKAMMFIAMLASSYGIWLLYASGLTHLLMSVLLYAPGLLVFLFARRNRKNRPMLHLFERWGMLLIFLATLPAGWLIFNGQ